MSRRFVAVLPAVVLVHVDLGAGVCDSNIPCPGRFGRGWP